MALPLDWRTDPVVIVEKDLVPLLAQVPAHLCARALGAEGPGDAGPLIEALLAMVAQLESGFDEVLDPTGFPLTGEARGTVTGSAGVLRDFATALGREDLDPEVLLTRYRDTLYPTAMTALDTVREVFITSVLKRQAHHAELSSAAMTELSQLSRSIQFVAINATIEAARTGTAGRTFALIASEIRELANKARRVIDTQTS